MNVVGQTLFLGASVVSFSSNIGWGGSNSSVTVELIEDFQPFGRAPFRKFNQTKSADYSELDLEGNNPLPKNHPGDRELTKNFFDINFYNPTSYPDNHYYECFGDDCYIDEKGEPYSTSSTKLEKNVPGKIYYEWVNNRFVSKYWYGEDPGFFATGTRINPDGVYEASLGRDPLASNLYIYDIVNTPVYFKFDNFEFIGLIRNWDRNNRPGGITYSVTIESFDELLDNCHVILQSFNGAIFNVNNAISSFDPSANLEKLNNNQIGGPVNFPAPSVGNFNDKIQRGNLPNVFNVYGFLESMGNNGFGGSKLNSEGLRANDILDSVQVLTSSTDFDIRPLDKAFSPFGRILTKNISNARDSSIIRNLKSFGIIAVNSPNRTIPNPAADYNSFRLDLSSLPRPPDNYRIQGNPSLSISQIIRQISDDTGVDFLSVVIPVYSGTSTDFIIKIITVNRTNYNPLYQIPSVVTTLEQNNFKVENSSFGQEKNNNYTRKLVFGGNQQRLYQVKNYRLSYNQNNLIYNPIINKFINTDPSVDKNTVNKIRNPDLSSTRNKIISDFIHPTESDIFLRDDDEKNKRFYNNTDLSSIDSVISDWSDFEVGRAVYVQNASGNFNAEQEFIQRGNYRPTLLFKNTATILGRKNIVVNNQQLSKPVSQRYISLFNDVICPYFGTKADKQVPIGDDSNEFRLPRPVLLDTWTNQITVIFDLNELPILSVGEPLSLYDAGIFGNATDTSTGPGSGFEGTSPTMTPGGTSTPIATNFGGAASNGIKPTRTLDYKAPGFTIKESEFRCPDWDSYLTYCLGKSIYSKPDLFVMLVNAYKNKGMFLSAPSADPSSGPGDRINRGPVTAATVATHQIPSPPNNGIRTNLNMNWDLYLNHNFIKDLQILFSFIKNLSDTYYGQKYAIKAPDLYSYKDTQYANLQIPSNLGNIAVYQGSNQISYDYEIASGAWEEYGNYIDDSIVCGDNNWQVLRNEEGLIPAILGYNNSANIDDVTRLWCELTYSDKIKKLTDQMSSLIEEPEEITKQINQANEALVAYNIGIKFIDEKIAQKTTLPEKDILKEMYPKRTKFDTAIPKVSLKSYRAKLINKQTQTTKLVTILKDKARQAALNPNNLNRQLADEQKKLRELKNRLKRASGNDGIALGIQIEAAQQKIQDILKKISLAQQLRSITGSFFDCSDPDNVSIPSIDISNLDNDSYVIIDKNIQNHDAFDRKVNSSKLYLKTNSDNIVFLDPINLSDPRIIVDSPSISLASSSYSYLTDPNLTVISNIALEDFNIINNLREETLRYVAVFGGSLIPVDVNSNIDPSEEQYVKYLLSYVFPIDKNRLVPQGASVNNASQHHMLMPKKATPFFAAIPLKSNRAVYGPWTNYPGLVMNNQLADNLIGNIKIEQNNDYVPWNYGGMSYLDKVVSYSMNVDVNYQNTIETGRVSIIGPPIFGIGGTFSYDHISLLNTYRNSPNYTIYDNSYYNKQTYNIIFLQQSGPNNINSITYNLTKLVEETYGSSALISNISIQTASDGLRTSYSFQTYNPKTGLFNKEISDNIKKQNAQLLKFNKLLFGKANNISNKQLQNINSIINTAKTSRQSYNISKNKTNLFGTSPVELIIGQAAGYVPFTFGTMTQDKFNEVYRNHHYAGLFPAIEVGSELLGDYDSKAAMSLDGLLSPVSFYPTRLNSTYSISDHSIKDSASNIEPICPRCNNKRLITIDYVDYSKTARPTTELKIACPVCSKTKINHNNKTLSPASAPNNINLYSLNPIIVSDGEFRNPHAGEEAAPKHSILAVSRGETLPVGEQSFLLSNNTINNDNTDYNENDNNKAAQDAATVLMNQRFFALRGPLMLHSWGFDAEGYPIPNANTEPFQIEANTNRPLRFVLTSDGLNDLSQQGRYEPEIDNNGQATKRLGDIITKQYTWDGSKYKFDQKKSVVFHKKWGERPDLWPVGPIDLRWDDKRKVWDASGGGGCKEEVLPPFIISDKNDLSTLSEFLENRTDNKCPYKMVYLTLEQDMVKEANFESTNPARAFLDDIEYSKEPLQNNFRRLVYVIDTAGYTAPRGAKLLCRYNRDNGFYEPVTKPILTALGSIVGNEAKIEMSYTQARRSGVLPVFATKFSNPLGLSPGTKGLFNYINGTWTLISTGQ